MQIVINPVDVVVSDGLEDYIKQRLNKFFEKQDYITSIEIFVKKAEEKDEETHIIEAIMHLPGPEIYANAAAKTHDAALNDTIDKLRRQLEKYKEKFHSHRS